MDEEQKAKKGRTMSPEMLEKLALARKKALEVKKKLAAGGAEAKLAHLQAKMEKVKITKSKTSKATQPKEESSSDEEEPVKKVKHTARAVVEAKPKKKVKK